MLAILALVAASVAITEPEKPSIALPEGVTCNDLFWTDRSRINPTELSDYQKCYLSQYHGETNSGSLGDLLWVRIDGEYFSVSKRKLQNSFGRNEEAAKKALNIEFRRQYNKWKAQQ